MNKNYKGFTLVELLVVIAIVAILAAVVVLIVNPLELTRRGRDAARLTDLAQLQQAINVTVQESTATGDVYCSGGAANEAACTQTTGAGTFVTNGTGWVKVNLGAQSSVLVPTLPRDPTNSGTSLYTYYGSDTLNGWEITALLESVQQSPKMGTDGGDNPGLYEVGSILTLE